MPRPPITCPYCGNHANLTSSAVVYGGRGFGPIYICTRYPTCDSYVGVHKGTNKPLGRMANAELRQAKRAAYQAFDPLWAVGGCARFASRKEAYRWLAGQLGLAVKDTHVGMMDVETCQRVVKICRGCLAGAVGQ